MSGNSSSTHSYVVSQCMVVIGRTMYVRLIAVDVVAVSHVRAGKRWLGCLWPWAMVVFSVPSEAILFPYLYTLCCFIV